MDTPQDPSTSLSGDCNPLIPTLPNLGGSPNRDDPCSKLNSTFETENFKSNLEILKTSTGSEFETGFMMTKTNGIFGNVKKVGTPGSRVIQLDAGPYTYCLMHSHYNSLEPIFSPQDINQFYAWLRGARLWNDNPANLPKIDLTKLTYVLVTSVGTYILTFDGTDVANIPDYTKEQIVKLNDKLQYDYISKAYKTNGLDNYILERQFLKFLKSKMNLPGVKLFKSEKIANTSNYHNTQIYLENGKFDGARKENKCY